MTDIDILEATKLLASITPRHTKTGSRRDKNHSIGVREFTILMAVFSYNKRNSWQISIGGLAGMTQWGIATVSETVSDLIQYGCLNSKQDLSDKRKRLITLTNKGLRILCSGRDFPWMLDLIDHQEKQDQEKQMSDSKDIENYLTVGCPFCFSKPGVYCIRKTGATLNDFVHQVRVKRFLKSQKVKSNVSTN